MNDLQACVLPVKLNGDRVALDSSLVERIRPLHFFEQYIFINFTLDEIIVQVPIKWLNRHGKLHEITERKKMHHTYYRVTRGQQNI